MQPTTLCYLIRGNEVLLALKKRGFGEGKWNGPGGKIQEGETSEEACCREVREEIGVEPVELEHRGVVDFRWVDRPEWDHPCDIYVCTAWTGEPQESEEMKPAWMSMDALPFDEMWGDDRFWLLNVLRGGRVSMQFDFTVAGEIVGHRVI